MNQTERKEVIQISGLSILVVMALVGDLVIAGLIFRWHQHEVFRSEKNQVAIMSDLLARERQLKNDIIEQEGVRTWNETSFVRSIPVSR